MAYIGYKAYVCILENICCVKCSAYHLHHESMWVHFILLHPYFSREKIEHLLRYGGLKLLAHSKCRNFPRFTKDVPEMIYKLNITMKLVQLLYYAKELQNTYYFSTTFWFLLYYIFWWNIGSACTNDVLHSTYID